MTRATVKWFSDQEGWGVLEAPEGPGGIFVHFSDIEVEGYRTLREGQVVEIGELEGPLSFDQDGCRYRAQKVRPADG
jgi:CspA family cold shock protein